MNNHSRVYELERRNDGTPPSNTLKDDDSHLVKGVTTGAIHSMAGFNNPNPHQYIPVHSNNFTDFTQKQSPPSSPSNRFYDPEYKFHCFNNEKCWGMLVEETRE